MCGIVGYVGKKRVVPVIIDGLRRLEYRGYDSAGIAVAGNGEGLQIRRAEGKLRNLEEVIRLKPLDGMDEVAARSEIERMAREVLTNPVIEEFHYSIEKE